MPHALVGVLFALHGLITGMIGVSMVTSPNSAAIATPAWLNWWPGAFGRSWLFDALNLGTPLAVVGGLLWAAAGVALIGGALGWLGVSALSEHWEVLALAGSVLGLVGLALYFHPFYLIAVVLNLAIVVSMWGRVATAR